MDEFLSPEDIFSERATGEIPTVGTAPTTSAPVDTAEAHEAKVLDLIDEMVATVEEARGMPLTKGAVLDRDWLLEHLRTLKDQLPEDLRTARWMIREREAFVARTNEKAHAITDRAKERAQELVSESHVLAEAVEEANILVRNAEDEARRIRLEAEDYSEDHLSRLETLFGNLLNQVRDARAELHTARPAPTPPPT